MRGRRLRRALGAVAAFALAYSFGCVQRDVIGVTVGSVTVSPSEITIAVGDSIQITATVRDAEGRTLGQARSIWSSDNTAIATVDADGWIRALATGPVTITASFRGVAADILVTVQRRPAIAVAPNPVTIYGAAGADSIAPEPLAVTNAGDGSVRGLSVAVSYPGGPPTDWLSATLAGSAAATTMTVRATPTGISAGIYSATLTVTSTDVSEPYLVPVELSLSGVTIDSTGANVVAEAGGVDSVTVALQLAPDTTVVLSVVSEDPTEVTVSPASLTFTPANWSTPQVIVLTGQDDVVTDGDQTSIVRVAVVDSLSDDRYDPVEDLTVSVQTIDDDDGTFSIDTGGSVQVSESGTTDSFTMVLDAQPLTPVVIRVAPRDSTEVSAAPGSLTFTPGNWTVAQTVTVTGVDDPLVDRDQVTVVLLEVDSAASDPAFVALGRDSVSVTTLDDDVASFIITQTPPPAVFVDSTEVSESGSTDSLRVVLGAQPVSNVVLSVTSDDPGEVAATTSSVTFTPTLWNVPQAVVLTGVDDDIIDGPQSTLVRIAVNAAASDDDFDALPQQSIAVTTIDDDAAGITISETGGSTVTNEVGTLVDTILVALAAQPASNVAIDVASSDVTEVQNTPARLTFTPGNWNVAQAIAVTGVDDQFDDGDRATPVVFTVDDGASDDDFDSVLPDSVFAVNLDDDAAGLRVLQTNGGSLVDEFGGMDSLTVALTARPIDPVVVTVLSSDTSEVTVAPATLNFTTSNWNIPQIVELTGVDDPFADGNGFSLVVVGVSDGLSDAAFRGVPDQTTAVTTLDNDAVAITVSPTNGLQTTEAGGSASFQVVLNSQPSADVVIGLTSSAPDEGVPDQTSVTFTDVTWNIPQTVVVTGVDDVEDDGDQLYSIVTAPATSTDPGYGGLNAADVSVTNIDDDASALSIDDVTVLEGDAGTVNAVFTVSLAPASAQTVSVNYTTADGSATAGSDYVATSGTLTFLPGGALTQTVTVVVNGDGLDEGTQETFTVTLSGATNAAISDPTGVGTITDDDGAPSFSIDDVTVLEGDVGTVDAVFTVTQSAPSGLATSVDFATVNGTATAGADFVAASGTATFLPGGALTQTITVTINGDLLDEGASESYTVVLSNPVNSVIGDGTGTGTITDDDAAPSFSINDVTVTEGNAGTVNAVFTVTQSVASGLTTSVDFATTDGTATAGSDYTANSGTLTFSPGGSLTQTITVVVSGDALDEGASESFTVTLSNASNASISDPTGIGTITDDDGSPSFSINDVSVTEGNAGTVDAVFTVTQSAASGLTTQVDFATADGTATAGADYVANSGTLTFAPGGPLTQSVTVVVNGDLIDEGASETFLVNLSNPVNASISDASGTGTIVDDEGLPSVSINDVTVTEGDAGAVNAVFTVTKSIASGSTVTVDFATADGTATAGSDYVANAGTVTFLPAGPLTQTITVVVSGDVLDEGASESFTVNLSNPVNASILDGTGAGTITDDDASPSFAINDVTVTEGDAATVDAVFTVTQSAPSGLTTSVDFATASGSATAGVDFVANAGTLTFVAGGPLTQTITVVVNGDVVDEGASESFTVGLANPSNATISDPTGVGTITDDDAPPSFSIDDVSVTEGNTGTVNAVFTVTQSGASGLTTSVDFITADGTALAGSDYTAASGTVTFVPGGALTQTITVVVIGDFLDEGASESFTVSLSNPSNATILDGTGLGTITDDDAPPSFSIDDVTVTEGNAGTVNAVFTVTQSALSGLTTSVDFATADGTATSGPDYVATSGTLTFPPGGSLTQTIAVVVNGDLIDEGSSESFTVNLSNPSNATISDPTGLGTITDDESPPTLSIDDVAVAEGDAGTVDATFTVSLSGASSQAITVDFATADGTATAGSDYVSNSGTLTFPEGGPLTQTVTVVVNGDVLDEGASESFTVNLTNAANASILDGTGAGTITDDDAPPSFSIDDVTVLEGDAGTVDAVFTVSQSAVSGLATSVAYTTVAGTATAGSDFQATAGTLTFLPGGPLTQTITVLVNGDLLDEGASEAYTVSLNNPSNATIADATGAGTITDDDDPPTFSIDDVTVLEGNTGTVNAVFTVTQSALSGLTTSVDYATADGTATAGPDYTAASGTLTFPAGGPLTQTITVVVSGDALDEGTDETFSVGLSNAVNATIADATGDGTITDDDDPPSFSINDVTVLEGNAGTVDAIFTVTQSAASGLTTSVDFATADGSATAGSDYVANSGTLSFVPGGALTQTITVVVNGDVVDEGASESFTVDLSNAVSATISDATGVGTIVDDEGTPSFFIDDVTVTEGDAGTVNAVFTVTQSSESGLTTSVDFVTADGSATAGSDYVANSGTLTFIFGGALTQTITVVVNGDLIDEGASETFTVLLSNPSNASILDGTGVGTITDDDDSSSFSIDDVTVVEGDAGTVDAVFTVTQSAPSGLTTSVDFATADGSATAGSDYVANTGTLTFLPGGPLTQTITVTVNGDLLDEGLSEVFAVNLSNVVNASIADGTGTGSITDDDDPPSFSIDDVVVTEGNTGTVNAVFTVTQSAASGLTTTVDYATGDGTASAGTDYIANTGTLTFTPGGPLTRTLTVVVIGDQLDEGVSESFSVTLSNATNATIADAVGAGTITDDDAPPVFAINDVSVLEGDAGTVNAVFTVTQSAASALTTSVDYATADGSATAGSDYVANTGTLTFLPGGALTQTITVVVNGDVIDEGTSETFTVNLTNPSNATVGTGTGTGTITDDDGQPSLFIDDVTVVEGDAGTVDAVFTVTQSAPSGLTTTVDFTTVDGTATAGVDYVANSGTVTFAPGGPLTQTITVVVNGDLLDEGAAETFSVTLSNASNAIIIDGTGAGSITDDDGPPAFSIDDVTVVEGDAGTVDAVFTVTQSAASGLTTSVSFATANGTASAGADYVTNSGTLTFLPGGALTQTITVVVNGDLIDEGASEAFAVGLSNPTNATIAVATGTGTITDDDGAPSFSIDDVTVVEGNSGTVNAVFTVTQSAASGLTTSVDFLTADGTATAGSDYTAASGTLTFLPGGPLTQTISVVVIGDLLDEGASESFTVTLSNPSNATIVDGSGNGTITDDDTAVSFSINDVTVLEGDAGTVDAVFTVTQSAPSGLTTSVDFATADGSATAGSDYVANAGTLTFLPGGALTQTVTVVVNGDLLDEGASETFTVNLSNPSNATIAVAAGVGTIVDDEGVPSLSIDDVTVVEGDAGTVDAIFTVTQSAPSGLTTSVDFATADGSATAGSDYVANSGTLTFIPAGPLTQTITVVVNGDVLAEGASESFTVLLTNPTNATVLDGTGVGTITDDDASPSFSIDDVTVTEGDVGTVDAVFTVTLSAASGLTTSVGFATAAGTASAGTDFVALSGTLTFLPGGPLTQTITVQVNGDLIDEGASEAFTVLLSNASNASITDATGDGTITDDDDPPTFSIDDVTVVEGNAGTVNAVFTVTQSATSGLTTGVDYATADGTATAGPDYTAASGTLTFLAGGALTQTVTVIVSGDMLDEGAAETFTVGLSNPSNATIANATGVGTITDDDDPPSFAINDVTVLEGDAGTVDAVFTVTQSAASGLTTTVDFTTTDGTATAGSDYVASSGTLTFVPGGALTQTITVIVNGDLIDEGSSETFTVDLSNPGNATISDATGVGTIIDDEGVPSLSIDDVAVVEGDAGTVSAVFTLTQSAESGQTVTVDFATADGSALAGSDYVAASGTVTFLPGGSLTQTVTVLVNGDLLDEGVSEFFTVGLSNAANASILDGSGTGTITDDDDAPSFSIDDVSVLEGDAGTVDAVFTVTQSAASGLTTSVNFATADGTATSGSDYVATSGTLTFVPGGALTQTITVVVNGDVLDEGASETFTIGLSAPVNATIATATGTGTIVDDEGVPSLSIDDVTVVEGNAGTVNAVFTVTQSAASGQTITVDYATADGTATAAGSDYVTTSGTLTFIPGGALTRTVTVVIIGDLLDEGTSEFFTVELSNASNATILDATGVGTITDDDTAPSFSINDVTVLEGDGGTVNAVFTVTQSAASGQTTQVDYATADGTASAGSDYIANTGTLTFVPGGPLSQTLTVVVNGDLADEGASETFFVNLSNPSNATIGDGSGTGTIIDDDNPPSFSIGDVTVVEGDTPSTVNAVFTVTQSAPGGLTTSVDYATADGTATAGPDYTATSGTLTFLPGGSLTQTITVVVIGDLRDEGVSESFTVELSNPVNATIADGTGVGTITDDDDAPTLSIDDVTVLEGNAGAVNAVFTVTQSAVSGLTTTVNYATADGTASAGSDYVATSGTLTFLPGGALTQTITVVVNGDLLDEGASETFSVNLSSPSNATITDATGLGTITDDDDPPSFSINDVSVLEGNAGTVNAVFTVTQSAASGLTTTVDFATADGTATAGVDYVANSGTLTFVPGGPLTQTITVVVNGDAIDEGASETFTVNLSNPTNATIADATGDGTIIDDEGVPTVSTTDVTVVEGDAGTVDADFVVTLSHGSAQTVTVDYATANGTAVAGSDYVARSGTLTFLPGGALTQTVTVVVNGDLIDEGVSEAFTFNLSNAVNATIADPSESGTITDDDDALFTIDDVTVLEGDAGTVNAVFTVSKSLVNSQLVTVDYATVDGTASSPADFGFTSGTLVFLPAGALTQTITVVVNGDLLDEGGAEDFTVVLSNASNASISDGTGLGTITDDDGPPSFSIDDVTVLEGDAGTVNAVFTVTQSVASGLTTTVDYATADGTATAGPDYVATSNTLTFLPGGALTQTVTVVVNGDLLDEGLSETFTVELTNPSNATISDASGTGTITDDDDPPSFSIDDVTVLEGNSGTVNAVFTVTQSAASGLTTSVAFATADATASAGLDYVANSGTLTFVPGGALTQTITVVVNGDVLDEGVSETFVVNLSSPVNATIADGTGAGTITDDDDASFSIDDVTVLEGNSGTVDAVFTVTQSVPSSSTTSVGYATADGTATASTDYLPTSGTLTFVPGGALTQTITVTVLGDALDEGTSEAFTVDLSSPTNATITDGTGLGTITDDDGPPSFSINDVSVVEGDAGSVNAVFTVTQSNASGLTTSVDFASADGTASAGTDYVSNAGTLTFVPGGALTQTITVTVLGDLLDEGLSENFTVNLSNPANATIADGTGAGTILDDDDPPSFSIDDQTVLEGDAGTVNAVFTVTQSAASGLTTSVDFTTTDGSATAGTDYTAVAGTLAFAPGGPLTQTITVVVNGDLLDEGASETFSVDLSNPSNASISDAIGDGVITDDDDPPSFSIDDVTVLEGDAGTVDAVFTVTQSAASGLSTSVDFATSDATASAGSDYVGQANTLTFAPGGSLTQTITVVVNGDLLDEGASEVYTVGLSNAVNASISDPTGAGTITDDDDPPSFSIDDVTVLEGNAGAVNAVFTVTLSAESGLTTSVAYATADGTATAGADYLSNSGTLTFLPGELSQTITVTVNGDLLDEGASEDFTVALTAPMNATISDASGTGTITDDDAPPSFSINDVTVTEGDVGTVNAIFTVTQSAASGLPTSVDFTTQDGTATVAGSDYAAQSGTLVFSPGGSLTQTITVVVNGDLLDEGASETYSVELSNESNATITDGTGLGTIADDDDPPSFSIDDVTVVEGNTGTVDAVFTVTQSAESGLTTTVAFATADGSATVANGDYVANSGTLTFLPGTVTQTITVVVNGDVIDEGLSEDFSVNLSTPTNANIADGIGAGTITDDDDPPSFSIDDVTVVEGDAGIVNAVFTVTQSSVSGLTTSVDFATADGTATVADLDYDAESGTVTFLPGETTQIIAIHVNGDLIDEGTAEDYFVSLTNPSNATIGDGTGVGTITDDDDPPSFSIDDVAVAEGNSGTVNSVFTVTQSAVSGLETSVDFATANGTAASGLDYLTNSGTLTFPAGGSLTQSITVAVNGDQIDEGASESYTVNLSGPTNATIADPVGAGTITDDDTAALVFADTTALTVSENPLTTDTFRVSLASEPVAPVTLTFQSDSLEVIADSATIVFTSANWNTLIDVPLTGVDDVTVDGDTVTILTVAVAAGSDAAFLGLTQPIGVTTIDDDDPGFTLTETAASTDVDDADPTPATDVVNVVLDRRPQNPVTINVTSANASIVSVVTTSVTFQPSNWDTPQPVTVSGVSNSVTANTTVDVTFSVDPGSNVEFVGLPDQVITVNVTNTN